jgi:signal transduction histidine kinase
MDRTNRFAALIIANKKLAFQNEEKEKRTAELIIANKELAFQDKEKQAAELVIANKELAFQNIEKENRAAELITANKELIFQSEEKGNRAAELIIANHELVFQNQGKEKRAAELVLAYQELKKTEEYLKEYVSGLEEMMFMTSHKVRQPVANILGLSNILDDCIHSPTQLRKLMEYLKQSALSLDDFTRELTTFISNLEQKGRNKS